MGKLFVEGLAFFLVGLQLFMMADAVAMAKWPAGILMALSVGIMVYSFYKSTQAAGVKKTETQD